MATEHENYSSTADRRRLVVHGRVQGVGYRYFARQAAMSRGIRGWAKNLSDGTVEVIAEGTPEAVAAFEADLSIGPTGSLVTRIEHPPFPSEISEELPGRFQVK